MDKILCNIGSCRISNPHPGQRGSLVALLLLLSSTSVVFYSAVSVRTQCLILISLTLVAVVLIQQALNMFGWMHSDPRQIVLDELIGLLVGFSWGYDDLGECCYWFPSFFDFLTLSNRGLFTAAERLSGSWGILLDDICAGLLIAWHSKTMVLGI